MGPEIESLLRDEGWVRALARRLVRDAGEAEDLVQEAWIAGRAAGAEVEGLDGAARRRWLGAVLRNRARQERRGAARRVQREREAARPEALEGPGELLARLELRERIVQAVRGLEEPYRSAILLRWFEGLVPREIARRKGVPRRTVHSWLARGLEKLRERLRGEFGSTRAWIAALSPLCAPPPAPVGLPPGAAALPEAVPAALSASIAPAIGILAMTIQAKLVGAAALAAVLVVTYLALPEGSSTEPLVPGQGQPVHARVAPAPAAPRDERSGAQATPSPAREALASAPTQAQPSAPPVEPGLHLLRGRVVDDEARPLGGLTVLQRGLDGRRLAQARTSGDGAFEFETAKREGELVLDDPAWTLLLRPLLWLASAGDLTLVAAPRIDLGGVVLDTYEKPLAGARVSLIPDSELRSRLPLVLDHTQQVERETRTDATGRFELSELPRTRYTALRVELEGFVPYHDPLPAASTWDLVIELERSGPDVRVLAGRVLGHDGAPLAGVIVALDHATARSKDDGTFALELRGPGATGVLRAAIEGRKPARLERSGDSNLAADAWPEPLELVLGESCGSLRGRVLDSEGEPVPGARVGLVDPTDFGRLPMEGMGSNVTFGVALEAVLSGQRYHYPEVQCDDQGRFYLHGLDERTYSVEFLDPSSLVREVRTLSPRPEEIEIRLAAPPPPRRVVGRALHTDGTPAVGRSVRLRLEVERGANTPIPILGQQVFTAEDGSFEFPAASAHATHVAVQANALGQGAIVPLPAGEVLDIELVLPRVAHLQVELSDPAEADGFSLLDAAGNPLEVTMQQGNFAYSTLQISLVDGRSQAVRALELARTLVLKRGGEEVRRVPITLVPGELNTVAP